MCEQPSVMFDLDMDRDTVLLYYQGHVQRVVTTALDGRVVSFPFSLLRQSVNPSGVHGRFRLYHDASGKFVRLERVW